MRGRGQSKLICACDPVVEHLPCNGRCGLGAEAAVFLQDGNGDFRIVGWRKGDEEPVIMMLAEIFVLSY